MWEESIQAALQKIKKTDSQRSLEKAQKFSFDELLKGEQAYHFSSNDYLGLARDQRLIAAQSEAASSSGAGASASRLVSGNHKWYKKAERALLLWKQTEHALIVGSGYTANLGVLQSLLNRHDIVFSDRLNHASIIDGIQLSQAEHKRYRHRDMDHLERLLQNSPVDKHKLIITDTVFSMDGDIAFLEELVFLKKKYDALLVVDEAHATGLFGAKGSGLCEEIDVVEDVDLIVGTFSKALGSLGAYITGRKWLVEYLQNTMRSFIFTTALPPAVLGSITKAIQLVQTDEFKKKRDELLQNASMFRRELKRIGFDLGLSETQIVPIIVGSNEAALQFSAELFAEGIMASAIRPPTVGKGQARIRFALNATHTKIVLKESIEKIAFIGKKIGLMDL